MVMLTIDDSVHVDKHERMDKLATSQANGDGHGQAVHLLQIPRELRNKIYSYLGVDREVRIKSPGGILRHIPLLFHRYPDLAMLLVCRQVRLEYQEVATNFLQLETSIMHPRHGGPWIDMASTTPLDLEASDYCYLARHAKGCIFVLNEACIMRGTAEAMREAYTEVRMGEVPSWDAMLARTPLDPFTTGIKSVLYNLSQDLSEHCKVTIELDVGYSTSLTSLVSILTLHPETIFAIKTDRTVLWPKNGNLDIKLVIRTPLFALCRPRVALPTSNDVDISASERGDHDYVPKIASEVDELPPSIVWHLRPTKDANSFLGFWPDFQGLEL